MKLFSCKGWIIAVLFVSRLFGNEAEMAKTVVTSVAGLAQLQQTLSLAQSNMAADTIIIVEGIYDLNHYKGALRYFPPSLPDSNMEEMYPLWIRGAGPGKTIINGTDEGNILGIGTQNVNRDDSASITVEGICFRNGLDLTKPALGIITDEAPVTVRNCRFVNCKGSNAKALFAGTGKNPENGTIKIIDCVFDSCIQALNIFSTCSLIVKNCSFTDNYDGNLFQCQTWSGYISLTGNTFSDNSCTDHAPVQCIITKEEGAIELRQNVFTGNHGPEAGAISIAEANADVTLWNNHFEYNNATYNGALLIRNSGKGNLSLQANTFVANRATNRGGAACIISGYDNASQTSDAGASIIIANNLFTRNRSIKATSLYVRSTQAWVQVLNNTFVQDSLNQEGKGIVSLCLCHNGAAASLMNNLFWGNLRKNSSLWAPVFKNIVIDNDCPDPLAGVQPDGTGAEVILSHNLVHGDSVSVEDNVTREANIDVDPLLNDSLRLSAGSPAIDAGTSDAHGSIDAGSDCAGKKRLRDGDEDGEKVIDIGAFEFKPGDMFGRWEYPEKRLQGGDSWKFRNSGCVYDLFGRKCGAEPEKNISSAGLYLFRSSGNAEARLFIEQKTGNSNTKDGFHGCK